MAFSCSTQGNLPFTTPAYSMSVYSMSSYPSYPSQPVSVAPPADDNEYANYDPEADYANADADWLAQQPSTPPLHMQLPPVSHLAPSVASEDDMAAFCTLSQHMPLPPVSLAPPADDNEYADYDPDADYADWLAQQHPAPPLHMQLPPVSHTAPSVASEDDMAAFFASQIVPSPPAGVTTVECDVNVGDNDRMVLYYEDDDGFSTVLFVEPPVYGTASFDCYAAYPVCDDDDAMDDL
jgi:hypothetical protein